MRLLARIASPLSLVAFSLSGPVAAGTADTCQSQYDEGRYGEAAACWSTMEQDGHHNGPLLFNLGDAHWRSGDLGDAMLAWRRAALFMPRDADLAANLETARRSAKDALPPPDQRGPAARWLLLPYDACSARELLWIGLVGWATFAVLLAARLLWPLPNAGPPLLVAGALAGFGLVGFAARSMQAPTGVVLAESIAVRSGRDLQAAELLLLHEGAEVIVASIEGGWSQVQLADGRRGFVPTDAVGVVVP
jgi:hypothetical protein